MYMKTIIKKFMTVILTLAMIFTVMPKVVLADELPNPTGIVWVDNIAQWNKVEGAEEYTVYLYQGDETYENIYGTVTIHNVTDIKYDFSEYLKTPGIYYRFRVQANKGTLYSAISLPSGYKLTSGGIPSIIGFSWDGTTVSWASIDGASEYNIQVLKNGYQVNGDFSVNVPTRSCDIYTGYIDDATEGGAGNYSVYVKAYNDKGIVIAEGTSAVTTIGTIETLTGTVTISGTAEFPRTLTANVSGDNNTGTLSYQWYRGTTLIDGATNNTYAITLDDVGKQLKCVVSSSIETGAIESAPTTTIPKAEYRLSTKNSCELKYKGSAYTVDELVEALNCIAEYQINGSYVQIDGTWNLVDPTVDLTNVNTTGVAIKFGFTPNDNRFESSITTATDRYVIILKADGPAAPTGLEVFRPTTNDNDDGKITGTTALMEYSTTSNFASVIPCTGSQITDLISDTYYVRIKETANTNAGAYATVIVPEFITPTLLSGEGGKYTKGSNTSLVFKSSADFNIFVGITVDGEEVDEDNYTAVSGSTIITLKPAYLETLAVGEHILSILSTIDSNVQAKFTIAEKPATKPSTYAIPKTGVN